MENRASQDGTSLIEIAVAMAVIAIIAFSVMLGFTTAGVQDRSAYETARAQSACIAVLEQVDSTRFQALMLIEGQPLSFQDPTDRWTFDVAVTQIQGDLLAIEVTASEFRTGSHAVRLMTLKTLKEDLF